MRINQSDRRPAFCLHCGRLCGSSDLLPGDFEWEHNKSQDVCPRDYLFSQFNSKPEIIKTNERRQMSLTNGLLDFVCPKIIYFKKTLFLTL